MLVSIGGLFRTETGESEYVSVPRDILLDLKEDKGERLLGFGAYYGFGGEGSGKEDWLQVLDGSDRLGTLISIGAMFKWEDVRSVRYFIRRVEWAEERREFWDWMFLNEEFGLRVQHKKTVISRDSSEQKLVRKVVPSAEVIQNRVKTVIDQIDTRPQQEVRYVEYEEFPEQQQLQGSHRVVVEEYLPPRYSEPVIRRDPSQRSSDKWVSVVDQEPTQRKQPTGGFITKKSIVTTENAGPSPNQNTTNTTREVTDFGRPATWRYSNQVTEVRETSPTWHTTNTQEIRQSTSKKPQPSPGGRISTMKHVTRYTNGETQPVQNVKTTKYVTTKNWETQKTITSDKPGPQTHVQFEENPEPSYRSRSLPSMPEEVFLEVPEDDDYEVADVNTSHVQMSPDVTPEPIKRDPIPEDLSVPGSRRRTHCTTTTTTTTNKGQTAKTPKCGGTGPQHSPVLEVEENGPSMSHSPGQPSNQYAQSPIKTKIEYGNDGRRITSTTTTTTTNNILTTKTPKRDEKGPDSNRPSTRVVSISENTGPTKGKTKRQGTKWDRNPPADEDSSQNDPENDSRKNPKPSLPADSTRTTSKPTHYIVKNNTTTHGWQQDDSSPEPNELPPTEQSPAQGFRRVPTHTTLRSDRSPPTSTPRSSLQNIRTTTTTTNHNRTLWESEDRDRALRRDQDEADRLRRAEESAERNRRRLQDDLDERNRRLQASADRRKHNEAWRLEVEHNLRVKIEAEERQKTLQTSRLMEEEYRLLRVEEEKKLKELRDQEDRRRRLEEEEEERRRRLEEEEGEKRRRARLEEERLWKVEVEKRRAEEEEGLRLFGVEKERLDKERKDQKAREAREAEMRLRLIKEESKRITIVETELNVSRVQYTEDSRRRNDDEERLRLKMIREEELRLKHLQDAELIRKLQIEEKLLYQSQLESSEQHRHQLEIDARWKLQKEQELLAALAAEEEARRKKYNEDLNNWRLAQEDLGREVIVTEEDAKRRAHIQAIEDWKRQQEDKMIADLAAEAEARKERLLEEELAWKLRQEEELRLRLIREEEERIRLAEEEEITNRRMKEEALRRRLLMEEEDRWKKLQESELELKLNHEIELRKKLTEEEEERRKKLQDSENARWRATQESENARWREDKQRENAIVLKNEEGLRMSMIVNLEYNDEPVEQPRVASPQRGPRRTPRGNRAPELDNRIICGYKPESEREIISGLRPRVITQDIKYTPIQENPNAGGTGITITNTTTTKNRLSQRNTGTNGYSSQQTPVQQNRNNKGSTERRVTTQTLTSEYRSPATIYDSVIIEKHVTADGHVEYLEMEESIGEHHHVPHHHHDDRPVEEEPMHKPALEETDAYFTRTTGKHVDSVVNCWRNPKDTAAREGYAARQYQTHNMHKMKPTADLMNSTCQHESWLKDKDDALSPKSRYNAEFCISQPGLMDHNRTKSSVIYGEPRSDFESRHVQSPTRVRNPILYHSTINEIEKMDRLNKSKSQAAGMSKERVPGLGKSYLKSHVQQEDFKKHKDNYFWEPSRERVQTGKKPWEVSASELHLSKVKVTPSKPTPTKVKPFNPESDSPNRRTLTNLTKSQTKKAKAHRIAKEESSKKDQQSSKKKRPTQVSEYWTNSTTRNSLGGRRVHTQYESVDRNNDYSPQNRRSTSPRMTRTKQVEYIDVSSRQTGAQRGQNIEYVYEEKSELQPTRIETIYGDQGLVRGKGEVGGTVVSREDFKEEFERFCLNRGGVNGLGNREFGELCQEFRRAWYRVNSMRLPGDFGELCASYRDFVGYEGGGRGGKVVEYVDDEGQRRTKTATIFDSAKYDKNFMRFESMRQPGPGVVPKQTEIVEVGSPGQRRTQTQIVEVGSPGQRQTHTRTISGPQEVITEEVYGRSTRGTTSGFYSQMDAPEEIIYEYVEPSPARGKRDYRLIPPKVDTNLIRDPEQVIEAIQVDDGYREIGEECWSPGRKVTHTSGVYATSGPLGEGHVGLNKVNPIHERIRNFSQDEAKHSELHWERQRDPITGDEEARLIVEEERLPSMRITKDGPLGESTDESGWRTHYESPKRWTTGVDQPRPQYEVFVQRSDIPSGQAGSEGMRMTFQEFERKCQEFEIFKRSLPSHIDENTAFKMYLDHKENMRAGSNSPGKRRTTGGSRSRDASRDQNSPGKQLKWK